MIYLSNKKILANVFVSTTNDHPVGLYISVITNDEKPMKRSDQIFRECAAIPGICHPKSSKLISLMKIHQCYLDSWIWWKFIILMKTYHYDKMFNTNGNLLLWWHILTLVENIPVID